MKIYKIIISGIVLFLIVCFSFYLNSIFGIISFIVSLLIYTIIFYLISIVWRKLRKKEIIPYGIFIQNFFYSISIMAVILFGLLFGTAYYFHEINPAEMPEYTFSNGEKTVKFQTMIHIAKPSFYEEIKQNLINFKKDGGVYFFEGVKAGTEENQETFDKALGVEFDEDLYSNLSKLYGITNQDNSIFLNLVNNKDFNVDVGIDQIAESYNEKIENIQKEEVVPINVNNEILNLLANLNEKELKILVYFNQAILNALVGNEKILKAMEDMNNKELFSVILDERNTILANAIINSSYKKIFVTYGKLHFNGVLELLKENDPNWKITETKYLYPMK